MAQFPDAPTAKELGYKVNPSGYGGLFVRSDVAQDKVALLGKACQETMADPDFLDHTAFGDRIRSDDRCKAHFLKNIKLDR